jgi:hydroxyacylglutathione hydrolase
LSIYTLSVGQLNSNCYLAYDDSTRKTIIIDPGEDPDFILAKINDLDLKPCVLIATHGHFDHVLASFALKMAFNIPFLLHQKDEDILKRAVKTAKYFTGLDFDPVAKVDHYLDQKPVILEKLKLKTILTPGHTPGSISLYNQTEHYVVVGDLIFKDGGYGRTDFKGGDSKKIFQSIKKILSLPKQTIIYPGHGPPTTVENEKKYFQALLK